MMVAAPFVTGMSDDDLGALNCFQEAGNQFRKPVPQAGATAVGIVVQHRMALEFRSDGTVAGTVLAKDQFSWAFFAMLPGGYERVCDTMEQAAGRAVRLLVGAKASPLWPQCVQAWADAKSAVVGQPMSFTPGPELSKLIACPRAVNYLNPEIVHPLPGWATPALQVATIYDHTFFKAA